MIRDALDRPFVPCKRREFLREVAGGIGGVALASLLHGDRLLAAEPMSSTNPLANRKAHFAAKATNVVQIFALEDLVTSTRGITSRSWSGDMAKRLMPSWGSRRLPESAATTPRVFGSFVSTANAVAG